MVENDTWALGSAKANVVRWAGATMVQVEGVLTAQAYERLHMRLSTERRATQITVMLDSEVLPACTNRSAVEAAVRGVSSEGLPAHLVLLVPARRLQWTQAHCALMAAHGLSCSARVIGQPDPRRQPSIALGRPRLALAGS